MSPVFIAQRSDPLGFPRMSGDEPLCGMIDQFDTWFSPHERG